MTIALLSPSASGIYSFELSATDRARNFSRWVGDGLLGRNVPGQLSLSALGFNGDIHVYAPDESNYLGATVQGGQEDSILFGLGLDDKLFAGSGNDQLLSGDGNDELFGGNGNDYLESGDGNDVVDGGSGDDLIVGGDGAGNDTYIGGAGIDTIRYTSATAGITVNLATGVARSVAGNDAAGIGTDSLSSIENIIAGYYDDILTGDGGANNLAGLAGSDSLTGGLGSDTIDGGSNVDTAIVSGLRAAYTVTQTSTGVWSVNGPDGTDTLSNIEYLKFDDETMRLLPGTGTSVNFLADSPATYMSGIRDFDGNDLGASSGWKWIGAVDVNGDGDVDQILVNRANGRFAEVGTASDGKVYFNDYGWAGETRVVGIYIDPLVQSGEVTSGGPNDSQRRFQNDLNIENISRVLGAADYDNDGLQEVYFALTDGTAYLHAYMHADGNIQYANYQSQQQVSEYLANNGWDASTASGWFG
jgi:hypothetical protein